MKKLISILVLILCSHVVHGQSWVDDSNFDDTIADNTAYDDNKSIIIIEFYADFNKVNAFHEWKQLDILDGVKYFRCDITKAPSAKKEYRIRMVPTILIFSEGEAFIKFKAKAGLDLLCPVDLPKMLRAIEVVKRESQF
tara:strand:- start:1332 stop:1748 length:417 start_codon:yes stop_codon:yes gene_type:complete